MNVKLIDYTNNALELLLYTKNTRLMGGSTLDEIKLWSYDKKIEHLMYMKNTIKSSWEFINFTFEIEGVTRAFTHQLVRTRNASYAQQSQRTVDVRNQNVFIPNNNEVFQNTVNYVIETYSYLIDHGMEVQNARGLLPTNMTTSIIAQFNLRTLHEMGLLRLCTRTQGEYQNVFKEMLNCVISIYPWVDDFIKVYCVWHGTCAFPNYKECPIQKFTIKPSEKIKNSIENEWKNTNHVANPIAIDGKTQ